MYKVQGYIAIYTASGTPVVDNYKNVILFKTSEDAHEACIDHSVIIHPLVNWAKPRRRRAS